MNNLEVEIAELQKMIETKRDQLEKAGGIIEEKELVRHSINEIFLNASVPKSETQNVSTQVPLTTTSTKTVPVGNSYLDNLDQQTIETINHFIAQIATKGVTPVINEVSSQEPFVIDAFHDALVDKLYDELKQRGLVHPME